MRSAVASLAALLLAASAPPGDPATSLLETGIRQYRDGDFEAAVFSLDSAVRKLEGQPGREAELARAYVFHGAAYLGLGHQDAAKGKFRKALELDPGLELKPEEFSQRVIKLFDSQRLRQTAEKKKKGTKLALILGGVGAAAAVGISASSSGGELPNRQPAVAIGVSPEGNPLAAVTVMTFRATGSDPDGDALSYRWTFGDGATAAGPEVTHRFDREGIFVVEVSAEDGRGGSRQAQATMTAQSITGLWGDVGGGAFEDATYQCTQSGASFDCRLVECRRDECGLTRAYGSLSDPRRIDGVVEDERPCCSGPCAGQVDHVAAPPDRPSGLAHMRCAGAPFVGFELTRR